MISNIIVAFSNIIPFLFLKINTKLVYLPLVASFSYHLSETHHTLNGIYPLSSISDLLLTIDRVFAIISVLYILITIQKQNKVFLTIGTIGVIFLLYGEKDYFSGEINNIEYVISHCIWHFAAFYCLLSVK